MTHMRWFYGKSGIGAWSSLSGGCGLGPSIGARARREVIVRVQPLFEQPMVPRQTRQDNLMNIVLNTFNQFFDRRQQSLVELGTVCARMLFRVRS